MADINFDCLEAIRDLGSMLGAMPVAIINNNGDLLEDVFDLAAEVSLVLLEVCPHPPNATSDDAPPRTFQRQLRELRGVGGWRDQPLNQSVEQVEALQDTLESWLRGMTGATPGAWRDKKARGGLTSAILRSAHQTPSAWRDKKARTRNTSQKMTGTRPSPSASFYGGGVPGTIPTGEPVWMPDPYQMDTSGQFIRKYAG